MKKINSIIANLNEEALNDFIKQNDSKIKATTKVHKVISDTSWIDMIESSIPYLDNIIRNPRRFIVQEENIVPIEKTKVVTEESIRHLAQNTNLIQDVEEDGTVIPLKLLNVYREETVDLYENRFIKSLVDNLYGFVNDKLKGEVEDSRVDVVNNVTYNINQNNLNVSLKIESKNSELIKESNSEHTLEERIEHIKEVIAAFRSSQFIKGLAASQPVRSPIRKTNVILKEPNFIKALELWEYLESNAIKPITEVTDEELDRSQELKNDYDFAFYIQNEALKLNKDANYDKVLLPDKMNLNLYLENLIKDSGLSEKDLKKQINAEIKNIYTKRKREENNVKKEFNLLIKEYERKKNKALLMLK